MKKIKSLFLLILLLGTFFLDSGIRLTFANDNDIDITTSSVREDLASMEMDNLSYFSEDENKFISLGQYYDNDMNLRTYVYLNYVGSLDNKLNIILSVSTMNAEYEMVEEYEKFDLLFVNNELTWCKFEILNLQNLENITRRYKVKSIEENDIEIINTEQVFIFNGTTNKELELFKEEIETITITDKKIAFYCYGDGANLYFWDTSVMNEDDIYTDAWYIFFNTDKKIDELIEIELTYTQYDYHYYRSGYVTMDYAITKEVIENDMSGNGGSIIAEDVLNGKTYVEYHDPKEIVIEPGTKKVTYANDKWFGLYDIYYEELDNIMDLEEYKAEDEDKFVFTDYAEKYKWGVHFKDTEKSIQDYDSIGGLPVAIDLDGSGMSDVSILRLRFKTNGVEKNLYAIDTSTSDFDGNAADEDTKEEEWFEKIMYILTILIFILILSIFSPFVKVIFEVLILCFKWILKGVLLIISLPFKLIGSLFNKRE